MKRLLLTGLVAVILTGCATPFYKVSRLSEVNTKNKSITVPSVGHGLFEIKEALRKDKWKIKVENASIKETGIKNDMIDSESKIKFDTAYRLNIGITLASNLNDGITTFNLNVVDNATNEEVVNMAGDRADSIRYDPNEISRLLVDALNNIDNNKPTTALPDK